MDGCLSRTIVTAGMTLGVASMPRDLNPMSTCHHSSFVARPTSFKDTLASLDSINDLVCSFVLAVTMPSSVSHHTNLEVSDLFDVKGLVAVVAGGGTGIGLMAAQTQATNGARVYIVGRREDVLNIAADKY